VSFHISMPSAKTAPHIAVHDNLQSDTIPD
jgi:hypothetical protein